MIVADDNEVIPDFCFVVWVYPTSEKSPLNVYEVAPATAPQLKVTDEDVGVTQFIEGFTVGLIVTVYDDAVPTHEFKVGVTVMLATLDDAVKLAAVNEFILDKPDAPIPVKISPVFVQSNEAPAGVLVKVELGTLSPLQ